MSAQWNATPSSVTNLASGVVTNTANPIQTLYAKMAEGNIADCAGGVYKRPSLLKSYRDPGVFVTLRGPAWADAVHAEIKANKASGGGDSINLGTDVGDLKMVRWDVQGDDRSALLSELHSTHRNVIIEKCKFHGDGDAYSASWNGDQKWLLLLNQSAGWEIRDTDFYSVRGEHCIYGHAEQGDFLIENCTFKHAGRTAWQNLARKYDGPIGAGDFTMRGCTIEDVCLESGGGSSAICYRGGYPNSTLLIENTKIRGGCDPKLAYNTASITGALVVDEEKTNGVPTVWPGGIKAVRLINLDIEYGTVFPGSGSAVRPILRVLGPCELLEIVNVRCHVRRLPTDAPVALEIGVGVQKVKISGTNDFVGQCWYRGTKYPTLDAMLLAHPELKA